LSRKALFIAALVGCCPVVPTRAQEASSDRARHAIVAANGRALQGDLPSALRLLRALPPSGLAGGDAAYRACMIKRFSEEADGSLPTDLPPIVARALGIYRAYWRAGFLHPAERETEAERLRRNLARLLGFPATEEMGTLEAALALRLTDAGFHSLMGRTPPFRELMLWKEQRRELKVIPLPEAAHEVPVVFLDEFVSLGWSNYATCGRSSTGGWVRPDGIYAVVPGWPDLQGERFQVSFLGHEAQHFADRAKFPGIGDWELEYRAKFTELALARDSLGRLLGAFGANQADDPALPHPYANRLVLGALRARLGRGPSDPLTQVPVPLLNRAAELELRADTKRRVRR
jgi:hypothetical protein